ncbi:MAG: hypothetical protein GXP27_11045 [Planctomycetes bacterium]|nr:hypothetical protein [Planctomycetota bacterium]
MTSSRDDILAAIRQAALEPAPDPDLTGDWTTYPNPREQFAEMLCAVGGRCEPVASTADITRILNELPAYAEAKRVCSLVDGVGRNDVSLGPEVDPHGLHDLDFAIAPAEFAVAENAAVWVTDEVVQPRAVLFIAQHVALVLPADQIVHNMHQAYQRLSFSKAGFGCFISGPSKTADIEQSLVIGAQGPRSLTVFLLEEQTDGKD